MTLKGMIDILNQMIEDGVEPSSIVEIKYYDGHFNYWTCANSIYQNVDEHIIITNEK